MHLLTGTYAHPSVRPPAARPQVFELHPGMHSQAFWHEISLLARCMHPRIVPVYGVAIQARRWVCQRLPLDACTHSCVVAGRLQAHMHTLAPALLPPVDGPSTTCRDAFNLSILNSPFSILNSILNSPFELPLALASASAQGQLLMVAVELMLGGSLRAALLDPERQHELRWDARCAALALLVPSGVHAPGCGCQFPNSQWPGQQQGLNVATAPCMLRAGAWLWHPHPSRAPAPTGLHCTQPAGP